MTKNTVSNKLRGLIVVNVAALTVAGAMLAWSCFDTEAQERTSAPEPAKVLASAPPADLEKAFWLCDYAGTTGSVDSGMAIACSTITEELKIRNFNGDFDAMVAWWQQNKPAEHQALEAASRANAGMRKGAPVKL